jgi:tyrosyl-tRNA synthetase
MYHGADAAHKAEDAWTSTFSKGEVPQDVPSATPGKLRDIVEGVSVSELRRLVEQGAVSYVESGEKDTKYRCRRLPKWHAAHRQTPFIEVVK